MSPVRDVVVGVLSNTMFTARAIFGLTPYLIPGAEFGVATGDVEKIYGMSFVGGPPEHFDRMPNAMS